MKGYLTILTWLVTSVALLGLACEQAASVKTDTEKVGIAETPAQTVDEPAETPVETPVEPAAAVEAPVETVVEPVAAEAPAEIPEEPVAAEAPAETPEEPAAAAPIETAAVADKVEVAVIVNGVDITESDIDAEIAPQLDQIAKSRGQKMPPAFFEQYRVQLRQRVLGDMITKTLWDEKVKENNIVITEDDITNQINKMIAQQGMTLDDLKALLEARGTNFDQWKQQMQFPKRLAYQKLMEAQFADQLNITEDDAKKHYSENAKQFQKPEQVRASHILIKPDLSDPNTDPNLAKAAAKARAEVLLDKIKAGVDFAQLAKANSDDPGSAKNGGDLNFFGKGQMIPPFEKTAFELEIGQVSGIVETRFGYHIIKLTDHKDAGVTTFEEVKSDLINMLTQRKQGELAQQYAEKLKAEATIVYPPGKEPKPEKPLMAPGTQLRQRSPR